MKPIPPRSVSIWILSLYALVGLMILVGGITRLTGSGLSITEWRPIMGALPPLNEAEWWQAFELYRATPQFQSVNHWMSLSDFQGIFFWEYFHRLLGRFLGVAFFLPWLFFILKGRLVGSWARRTLVAFVLGGLQGALGWFMVASGLVDVPRVSHFRLAAHLGLAFLVGQYLLWLYLDLRRERREHQDAGVPLTGVSRRLLHGFLALQAVQTIYGAFMAGSRAGHLFNTFPDMNGAYFIVGDYLNDPVAIHFVHRSVGWAVGVMGLYVAWRLRESTLGRLVGGLVLLQFGLGVATVLTSVALPVAAAHQLGAWALLSATVVCLHRLPRPGPVSPGPLSPDPSVPSVPS